MIGEDKKKDLDANAEFWNSYNASSNPTAFDEQGRELRLDGTPKYWAAFEEHDRYLAGIGTESFSKMVLRTRMLGDAESKNFELDENGEYEDQAQYATVGSHVECSGQVLSPDAFPDGTAATWNIKVESTSGGYKKEYDDVPTGAKVDFSVPTSFGETTLTVKLWSSRGAMDAGVTGTLEMSD